MKTAFTRLVTAKPLLHIAVAALGITCTSCSTKKATLKELPIKDTISIPYIITEDSASIARKAAKEELKYVLRPCECKKCR